MKQHFLINTHPVAEKANIVTGQNYRITMLTDRLVRLEYSPENHFTDLPTQVVWHRDFPAVSYQVNRTADGVCITTKYLTIRYDEKAPSPLGFQLKLRGKTGNVHNTWSFGDRIWDLRGTARTLDGVNGNDVDLSTGILSRDGLGLLDDSRSLLLTADGWISPRNSDGTDIYLFAYGRDYLDALRDFYRLCGATPMLPRFTLGNWWSRYYKYTQSGYLALMDRFELEEIPLSVAVIDMDWHLVNIDPKYGSGWTGFTWNRDFFPDHKAFLAELHRRGMKTTLNLHPADGIRGHEAVYPTIAKHMGVDETKEEPVEFDPTNPKFLEHYYADVLNPMENEGVDFWWVDWQQGTRTKIPGLDPLWVLNHFDYLDSGRDGKRPLTFSRYSGPGSHRYPIGFSGDTYITWDSLRFQPYFTATASNIGYGWWSHDIGGHMHGVKNDELMARWTQLGAFSPILRLHSSNSDFNGKEPWRFKLETADAMKKILRLRHRMIPYLYTMSRRNYAEGLPLVQPLYYQHPMDDRAYEYPTEYYFGSQLLVQPVTTPRIPGLNAAKESMYLPEGLWYDIFENRPYRGGRELNVYRALDKVPVFAKAGAIIPMTNRIAGKDAAANPDQLLIRVFLGSDGTFTLYEDDNETTAYDRGQYAETTMTLQTKPDSIAFTVSPVSGDCTLLPETRSYTIEFTGCCTQELTVMVDNEVVQAAYSRPAGNILAVTVDGIRPSSCLRILLPSSAFSPRSQSINQDIFDFLNQAELEFDMKDRIMDRVCRHTDSASLVAALHALDLTDDLFGALLELITAY